MSDASPAPQYPPVPRSIWCLLAALVLIPIVSFFASTTYFMHSHPVSMARLKEVRLGMNEAQVRQSLGEPSDIDQLESGDLLWTYHGWTWCVVRVRFAPDGTVAEVDHDH